MTKDEKTKIEIFYDESTSEQIRVRLPAEGEVFGVLESRVGAGRSRVICSDGKVRICSIPGRLRRKLWLREGDVVIVKPWEFEGDKKGDILHKYSLTHARLLKSKGYLKELEEFLLI